LHTNLLNDMLCMHMISFLDTDKYSTSPLYTLQVQEVFLRVRLRTDYEND